MFNPKPLIKKILKPVIFSVPTTQGGRRYRVPIMRGVGGSLKSDHEPWMKDALQRLGAANGLIDIGVNIGQTLLKYRSFSDGRYVGFEPNPFCIQYVKELIELNGLADCTIVPTALSNAAGLIHLYARSDADAAASVMGGSESQRQVIVAMVFDEIASDLKLDMPVVKIDVEGAEVDVIAGMTGYLARRRPMVLCEVLPSIDPAVAARNQRMIETLNDLDYSVFRVIKGDRMSCVERFEPIAAFPQELYTNESPWICDYLFAPKGALQAGTSIG